MTTDLDRIILDNFGTLKGTSFKLPEVFVEKLKAEGYNLNKLMRIKLLEVLHYEVMDQEIIDAMKSVDLDKIFGYE